MLGVSRRVMESVVSGESYRFSHCYRLPKFLLSSTLEATLSSKANSNDPKATFN